ncbi:MAG: sulfotransferase domain-containing protein [Microcoleaceae cyanobacterium MO_207.B10]|nr:sulfotransferase domain-containing protein [Microcoleaceae cyanobacterium MO_207.B10]
MLKKLIKDIAYPILKSPPDFLIIGAQKPGTTSLYNYLIQHPQILKNNSFKEVHYFNVPENYSQGLSWYLGHFPNRFRKGDKLTLDATPNYLELPHIPQLIKQHLGNIKMIAVLRNPVDRAYSAWKMCHSFGTNPNVAENLKKKADRRTFSEAIEQELTNQWEPDIYPYGYVNKGKYAEQLENYYKYFERDTILVLNFDNLKDDLASTLNLTCDFLNIDPFSESSLKSLLEKKYNVGKKQEISPSEQEVLDRLKNYFEPFNQKLYELLGYSFNW